MADNRILFTDRFMMRPLEREDGAALFPTLSNEEQCRYLSRARFETEEELWGWLAEPGWPGLTWIAVERGAPEDGGGEFGASQSAKGPALARFVAVPGHAPDHAPGHAPGVFEIGYITVVDRQGEGIAKECARVMIGHLFAQGARKLTAEVDVRNTASVALLEKLGFTREAHLREHDATHIGLCDIYWYGLLKREWDEAAG